MGRTAARSSALGPDRPTQRGDPGTPRVVATLVGLADLEATDAAVVGGKAAALAQATRAGMPTLPGVVVPVGVDLREVTRTSPMVSQIRAALGPGALIARSSSPWEDTAEHSMAGRFVSIGSLADDDELAAALPVVAGSGERVALEERIEVVPPVAVLVQPMVEGVGGVCFGLEPVTGRTDRFLAVVSSLGPEAVAAGRVDGVRHLLTPLGRLLRRDGDDDDDGRLSAAQCVALAGLVASAGELFGGPQDIEFLFERDGTLRLLQSRPVTTPVRGTPVGPVYGPGPVAETFPDPLLPLEQSLWVEPLRAGVREALRLSALAGHRELERRELVVIVDGRVAIDLELAGDDRRVRRWYHLDLRGRAREARASWRVGRLRGALPALARDVVRHTDDLLADVGPLGVLADRQLVGLLGRSRELLLSLHAHEVLMGLLVTDSDSRLTGVSVAMRSLIAGRRDGLSDDEIVARSPVVLALTGPRLEGVRLPRHLDSFAPPLPPEVPDDEAAVLREGLRLRVRWVQELTVRAVRMLADRLVVRGTIVQPGAVAEMSFPELAEAVDGTDVPAPVGRVADGSWTPRDTPPLPARFRFDADHRPVPIDRRSGDGTGAGGGRARGRVVHDPGQATPGTILVVQNLSPRLGPVVGRVAGLVAETGSPLAHIAILAREAGVAIVVGSPGATSRFDVGVEVEVDGVSGAVTVVDGGRSP